MENICNKPLFSISLIGAIFNLTFHPELTMETVCKALSEITPANMEKRLRNLEHTLYCQSLKCHELSNLVFNRQNVQDIKNVISGIRNMIIIAELHEVIRKRLTVSIHSDTLIYPDIIILDVDGDSLLVTVQHHKQQGEKFTICIRDIVKIDQQK